MLYTTNCLKILVYDLQTKASYKMSLGNFFVYIIVLFLLYFVLFCILYYILELFYYVSRYSIFSFNNLKTNHWEIKKQNVVKFCRNI